MSTVVLDNRIKKGQIMRKLYIIILLSIFSSCSGRMDQEARTIISALTLEQKIGQLLMFALPGASINRENIELIRRYLPGGVVFFGYNFSETSDLPGFTNDLQTLAMENYGIPLFISTDQEGGRVIRITKDITQFPGNFALGVTGNYKDIEKMARFTGMELRMKGINMNLAPVIDVNNNPLNPVINNRSFGSSPEVVAKAGSAYIKGIQSARCIAVAKHFPGHGDTESDSHHLLPVINHDLKSLKNVELVPFDSAFKAKVECVMSAHIRFPFIEEGDKPATLSHLFLTDLLRGEMKFNGIVMTDDLEMNAVSGKMDLGEAAVQSFLAGSDVILVSSYGKNIPLIYNALLSAVKEGVISMERLDDSVKRIIELKLRYKIAGFNEEENQVYLNNFEYKENEKRLLAEKDEINRNLSRGAISYSGDGALYSRAENEKRKYVSSNIAFRGSLDIMPGDDIFYSAEHALSSINRSGDPEVFTVVLQTYRINKVYLQSLSRRIKSSGGNLLLVYSGNPFDLSGWETDIPVLFTYSFTDESMKQAAFCLNGSFAPSKKINSLTGFRD